MSVSFGRTRARDRARFPRDLPRRAGFDFRSRTPGYSTTPLSGFGFSRASSIDSVQTSESTLVICPTQADVMRFGRWQSAWDVGLSLGGPQTNYIAWSYDYSQQGSPGKWTDFPSSSSIIRTAGRTDPSGGTSATRVQITAATHGLGEYAALTMPGETAATASVWIRNGTPNTNFYRSIGGRTGSTASAGASWSRVSISGAIAGGETTAFVPVDGRDWSAVGGLTAGTRDAEIFGASRTGGTILDEAILTNGSTATRAGTLCWIPARDWMPIVAACGGRLRIELDFRVKGSRAKHATYGLAWLWHTFDNASCWCDPGTGTTTIRDTTGATNTWPMPAFSDYDRVRIWTEAGAGVATSVQYRLNGGLVVAASVTGSPLGAMATSTARDLYVLNSNSASAGHVWCWAYQVWVYPAGQRPDWAA